MNEPAKPSKAVVFLHIPKTSGTAITAALKKLFSPEEVCPAIQQELPIYRLFAGHYYWNELSRVPSPRILFTVLREPRARLLSLYYYFRCFPLRAEDRQKFPGRRKAQELLLRPYLMEEDYTVRRQVDNVITARLTGKDRLDSGRLILDDDDAVDLAIEHLKSMDAFGLMDRYPESAALIRRAGIDLPPALERVYDLASLRKTSGFAVVEEQAIDEETAAEIRRCTRLDNRVYQWALGEFERRAKDLALRAAP
jgi:hypothetical protein